MRNLINGQDILLTSTILQELRKAPPLLERLEDALQGANVFLLSDMTRFWWTDICNFLNVDRLPINSLEVYPLLPGFLQKLVRSKQFFGACAKSEEEGQWEEGGDGQIRNFDSHLVVKMRTIVVEGEDL